MRENVYKWINGVKNDIAEHGSLVLAKPYIHPHNNYQEPTIDGNTLTTHTTIYRALRAEGESFKTKR